MTEILIENILFTIVVKDQCSIYFINCSMVHNYLQHQVSVTAATWFIIEYENFVSYRDCLLKLGNSGKTIDQRIIWPTWIVSCLLEKYIKKSCVCLKKLTPSDITFYRYEDNFG